MNLQSVLNMNKSPLELCPGIIRKGTTKQGTTRGSHYTAEQKLAFLEVADKRGALAAEKETGIGKGNYSGFRTQRANGLLL